VTDKTAKRTIDIAALKINRNNNNENAHASVKSVTKNNIIGRLNNKLMLIISLLVLAVIYIVYLQPQQINAKETDASLTNKTLNKITELPLAATVKNQSATQQSLSIASKSNSSLSTQATTEKVLDASGHIVARRIATVSSRITGKITKLNIEEGQKVIKNQVLAELDDEKAKISYQLALADLAASKANLDEISANLTYQQQRWSRNQSLLQQKLISQQLIDDSAVKIAQLKAQRRNKIALLELANQRLDLAQYQLNHHKIRAPFSGVVISKNAQVGELISTGSSAGGSIRTGVGTIVDMNSLEIEVEVGESYINRVFAGQSAIATLDAYPDWQIKSEVAAIIPTADRQKASIKVRIKLLTNDLRIFPDMSVKVSFLKS